MLSCLDNRPNTLPFRERRAGACGICIPDTVHPLETGFDSQNGCTQPCSFASLLLPSVRPFVRLPHRLLSGPVRDKCKHPIDPEWSRSRRRRCRSKPFWVRRFPCSRRSVLVARECPGGAPKPGAGWCPGTWHCTIPRTDSAGSTRDPSSMTLEA